MRTSSGGQCQQPQGNDGSTSDGQGGAITVRHVPIRPTPDKSNHKEDSTLQKGNLPNELCEDDRDTLDGLHELLSLAFKECIEV